MNLVNVHLRGKNLVSDFVQTDKEKYNYQITEKYKLIKNIFIDINNVQNIHIDLYRIHVSRLFVLVFTRIKRHIFEKKLI